MSSNDDFQELGGFADNREKLDGFMLFGTGSPQDSKNAEPKFNIRNSLAWDNAFFTSPGVLEPEELLQTTKSRITGNAVNILGREEKMLLPSDSLELERRRASRIDKCNFRKSLAWDNAFFTSAGVLDPEELSIVNRGFKKFETHNLPGIAEVWRSTESISTIDSGCSSLTSLEIELFEDERSSVQKSTTSSGVTTSSLKLKRGRGMQNVHSSKTPDTSSWMRMKAMPTSQIRSLNVRQPERILNEASASSHKQLAAGNRKFNPSASLKPPKISSRAKQFSPAATKRASSLGENNAKMGTAKAAPGQCLTVSKNPCLGGSCSVTHSFSPSPKSSSSVSPTATQGSAVFCSPYKRFCNASEDTTDKPPLNSRRKIDSSVVNLDANGFNIRTPLRSTKTNRDELKSPFLLFTPKSSSYTSPASSLDGWSSESSSTSVNQRSKSSEVSLDSISRQVSYESDAFQASDLESHSHDQLCIGHGNQETRLPNQKMSVGTGPVPSSASIKRSGLRVPSPKLGFFDEEFSLVRSSSSTQFHSGAQSIVFRRGTGNINQDGAANQNGKLQPSRTLDGTGHMKLASRRAGTPRPILGTSPWYPSHNEVQNASLNEPAIKKHDSAEPGIGCCSEGLVKNSMDTKNVRKVLEGVTKQPTKENQEPNVQCPGNNLCTLQNNDRDNGYYLEDQIDGLTKNVGCIDLGCNVVMEIEAGKSVFHA